MEPKRKLIEVKVIVLKSIVDDLRDDESIYIPPGTTDEQLASVMVNEILDRYLNWEYLILDDIEAALHENI